MISHLSDIFRKHKSVLPEIKNHDLLLSQSNYFFRIENPEKLSIYFNKYLDYSWEKGYTKTLGEKKTLCVEEAFLILLTAELMTPHNIVEIGTQYGKSTRRILDIIDFLVLDCSVTCFDIEDQIRFVAHNEIDLKIHDLTNDFRVEALDPIEPELIFLDAHPYNLLHNVIHEFLDWSLSHRSLLVIHDCTPHLYKHKMSVPKDDFSMISSSSGHWERHVLSSIFKKSPDEIDEVRTQTHHFKVFNTTHGLGLLAPIESLIAGRRFS